MSSFKNEGSRMGTQIMNRGSMSSFKHEGPRGLTQIMNTQMDSGNFPIRRMDSNQTDMSLAMDEEDNTTGNIRRKVRE